MNWQKEAINDLRCHEKRKAALESLADELRELRARTYGTSSPAADAVPVQGGSSTAEGRWIDVIDELERKKEADWVTVQEYRNRHPKCQYCGHLRRLWLPPFCVGRNTWCQAKEKLVNENLPRPFCRLFKVRVE